MKLNIKDIARLSGVAVSTVSRVLNDHPDVSIETRDLVMGVMSKYHYIPNNSARNLKRTVTNTVGVMVKGRDNPFFSQMIAAIEAEITQQSPHMSLLLHYHHSNLDDIEAAMGLVKEKRLIGLICLGGDFQRDRVSALDALGIPIVLTSVEFEAPPASEFVSTVSIKNADAADAAVSALLDLGHRRIGLVATSEWDRTVGRLRIEGYRRAMAKYRLPIDDDLLVGASYTFESGYQAGLALVDLPQHKRPTAIFAISDIMAIGVAKAVFDRGLSVPETISVMGFDGLDYGAYFHPALATVCQPVASMGHTSALVLLDHLKQAKPPDHLILETTLSLRASVGNPK